MTAKGTKRSSQEQFSTSAFWKTGILKTCRTDPSGSPETSRAAHGTPARLPTPGLQIARLSASFRPGLPIPMPA